MTSRFLPASALLFCFFLLFISCEKKEQPILLPPKGSSSNGRVDMGEDYLKVIYYDLESGTVVKTSDLNGWDLALEAAADGYHIFMNGGKNVLIYPTSKTVFADVTTANVDTVNKQNDGAWKADGADGLPAETAVGEWLDRNGISKNLVYVVSTENTYFKFRLRSVTAEKYVMEFGALNATTATSMDIPKNTAFNYIYFSFSNPTHVVDQEPEKDSWDVVFTRYRHIYTDLQNFKYIVTGALLNPYRTTGAKDSTDGFANIGVTTLPDLQFVPNRDVIGFDWKSYDYNSSAAVYVTNPKKCFVIKNYKAQIWKLHFLDFYSPTGIKGSPSFEYERIQ